MFKRLFWVGIGVVLGVIGVTKMQAYMKARTPEPARSFFFSNQQTVDAAFTIDTLKSLIHDFHIHRTAREHELIQQYSERRS